MSFFTLLNLTSPLLAWPPWSVLAVWFCSLFLSQYNDYDNTTLQQYNQKYSTTLSNTAQQNSNVQTTMAQQVQYYY